MSNSNSNSTSNSNCNCYTKSTSNSNRNNNSNSNSNSNSDSDRKRNSNSNTPEPGLIHPCIYRCIHLCVVYPLQSCALNLAWRCQGHHATVHTMDHPTRTAHLEPLYTHLKPFTNNWGPKGRTLPESNGPMTGPIGKLKDTKSLWKSFVAV